MKKRILAALVLLAMIIGLCGTLASAEETGKYMVGYAKVDIDPYYTEDFRKFAKEYYPNVGVSFDEEMSFYVNIGAEGDQYVTLKDGDPIPVALQGNSHTDVRLNIGNQDDNGDGIVDENDGVFATAIAITAPGDDISETVILMSTEFINANATVTAEVRKNLFEAHGITGDRVMIDGSHSHHAPGISPTVDKVEYPEVYYLQAAWGRYVRTQLTQAAELAIADRAEATMSRGSIEAEEALCAQGEVGDYLNEIRAFNAEEDPEKYGNVEYVTELVSEVPAEYESEATTIPGYDHQTWEEDGITHVAVPEMFEDVYYNGVRHDQSARAEATRVNAWYSSGTYYAYSYPKTTDKGYVDDGLLEEGNYVYIPSSWKDGAWLTVEAVEALGYATPEVFATGNNFNSNFAIDGVGGKSLTTKYIRLDESVSADDRLTRDYIDGHLVDESEVSFVVEGDEDYAKYPGRPYFTNEDGNKEYLYVFQDIWVATEDHEMTEVDDTLLVMKFTFEDTTKLPILLVNWRSHTNKNRKSSMDWKKEYTIRGFYESFYQVSSDWINALRYGLEFAGYRVAYFSGASGNVNGYYSFQNWYIPEYTETENSDGTVTYTEKKGTLLKAADVDTSFTTLSKETYPVTSEDVGKCKESIMGYAVMDSGYIADDATHLKNAGAIYGTELAQVALELLGGKNESFQMVTIDEPTGGIRSQQIVYETEVKEVSLAEFLAAGMHRARDYAGDGYGNNLSTSISFDVTYWELEEGNTETAIIDETYVCSMLDENGYPAAKVDAHGQATEEVYTRDEILTLYPGVEFEDDGKVSNCFKKTEQFAIAAYLHANNAISDYKKRHTATGTLVELNAIMLCDQIAIITAPGELYDRYSDTATWTADGYTDTPEDRNMWEDLWDLSDGGYGEPFYLGYCNASTSYMPSQVTYEYNNTSTTMAKGSYETQITSFAQGTGEDIMVEFDWLLDQVNGSAADLETRPAYCEHCDEEVTWSSLTAYLEAYNDHTVTLNAGHYYVAENTTVDELTVTSATSVCLDLNGCTLTGTERAFTVNAGGVLNIQDSSEGNTGKLQGSGFTTNTSGKAYGSSGGTVYVDGTLNLYSGTLTQNSDITYLTEIVDDIGTSRYKPGNGGVLYVDGIFNMYGGTVTGGNCGNAGGNIYTGDDSALNLYAGSIANGKSGVSGTACSRIRGNVTLSGTASVYNLLIWPEGDVEGYYSKLTVKDTYTGTAKITFRAVEASALTEGKVIGLCENADIAGATLTVTNASYSPVAIGSKLVLGTPDKAACPHCGADKVWVSLTDCFEYNETITSGHYYVDTDGDEMAEQLIADGVSVCLDLRGNDLLGSERAFEIASGGTLNIMDTLEGGTVAGQGFAEIAAGEGETARGKAGGTVCIDAGGTLNLRSGTLTLAVKDDYYQPDSGGVVDVSGTFNMYDGVVRDGISGWFGGNIMVERATGAQFNMYGGAVTGGTCSNAPLSACVAARNTVRLANDASIDSLQLYPNNNLAELLTVQGTYTGSVALKFHSSVEVFSGLDIGTSDSADLSGASLTVAGNTSLIPMVSGTDIKLFTLGENTCAHCNDTKNWLPLSTYLASGQALTTGHYYVDVDGYEMAQQTVADGVTVCLDLNGYTLTGSQRAFVVSAGGMLNIQDSSAENTGKLQGSGFTTNTSGNAYGGNGGTVHVSGTLNLYSGTLTQNSSISYLTAVTEDIGDSRYKPGNGGVLCVTATGTFNMSGGTVTGGNCGNAGGNLYVYAGGTAKLSGGGAITGGSAKVGDTECAIIKGTVTLEDTASVDLLQLWPASMNDKEYYVEMLTVKGAYTGTTVLSIKGSEVTEAGLDIGTSDGADLTGAKLTVDGHPELYVAVSEDGEDIILAAVPVNVAQIVAADGTEVKSYESLTDAITDYQEGQRVVLLEDVEDINVTKNVTLDLNGKNITGTATVDADVTLSCMDSANVVVTTGDDGKEVTTYNAELCGNITAVELGNGSKIVGAEATETTDVYLKVEEGENSNVSFHAVGLKLTEVSLRPSKTGIYYKSNFAGDSVVQSKVESYGVALSIVGEPTEDAMGDTTQYTSISNSDDSFGSEDASATSSCLTNIMKTTQGNITNRRNAATPVYGRAYIKLTDDGGCLFGYSGSISLQQLVEAIDLAWDSDSNGPDEDGNSYLTLDEDQLTDLVDMYNAYSGAMKKWNIPKLIKYVNSQ